MKAYVDDSCIACGLCQEMCPEVFELGDEDVAKVIVDEVPEQAEDTCREAADRCPVSAIRIEE